MHVAIVTALIIAFLFLIGFKFSDILLSRKSESEIMLRRMKSDYHLIKRCIDECKSEKQLSDITAKMDAFFDKYHKSNQRNKELQMYYTFLLRVISKKKKQFNGIKEISA